MNWLLLFLLGILLGIPVYYLMAICTVKPRTNLFTFILTGNEVRRGIPGGDRHELVVNDNQWILKEIPAGQKIPRNFWRRIFAVEFIDGIIRKQKVAKIPIYYKDIALKPGSTHVDGNLAQGLTIERMYNFKFDGIEFAGGLANEIGIGLTVQLIEPITAYERGKDIVIDISGMIRGETGNACVKIDPLAFNSYGILQDLKKDPKRAGTLAKKLRQELCKAIEKISSELQKKTGYMIKGQVQVQSFTPGKETLELITKIEQIRVAELAAEEAKSKKKQTITEAEADADRKVLNAYAEQTEIILKAEAEAAEIKLTGEADAAILEKKIAVAGERVVTTEMMARALENTSVKVLSVGGKGISPLLNVGGIDIAEPPQKP